MGHDVISARENENAVQTGSSFGFLRKIAAPALTAGRRLSDAIMPPLCLSCRSPIGAHEALCVECWSKITFIREPLCDVLGIPLPFGEPGRNISGAAAADPPAYARARAVALYDGVMRELVHNFKFRDRHDARRLFVRWMLSAGHVLLEDADVIVPVPLSRWRLLWRRFNQSAILAQHIALCTGKTYAPAGLMRSARTKSQVGLSRAQRRQNVEGAFMVPAEALPVILEKKIVLIDDIITTGATANSAAKTLLRAGAGRVDVLALAMVCEDRANLV